jgi:hypothetical protein
MRLMLSVGAGTRCSSSQVEGVNSRTQSCSGKSRGKGWRGKGKFDDKGKIGGQLKTMV